MKETILVIEDDASISKGLQQNLSFEGYSVFVAPDGERGLELAVDKAPDLIVLDVMMPKMNGFEVLRELRRREIDVPVIMLTAKGEEIDKVVGLEIGADDYVVKPFSVKELLARIRAALRRAGVKPNSKKWDDRPIAFGDVRIDARTLKGRKGKREFALTLREVQLIQFFMTHDGEAMDRGDILEEVWGQKYEGTTRTLDQHVAKLRHKIESDPSSPRHILTVHGLGYRFISK